LIHAIVTEGRRKVTGFVVGIKRRGIPADTKPRRHTAIRTPPEGKASIVTDNGLIRIMCPNLSCQRILVVPEGARGKVVRCSMCGMNIRIPARKKDNAVASKKAAAEPAEEDGATTQ